MPFVPPFSTFKPVSAPHRQGILAILPSLLPSICHPHSLASLLAPSQIIIRYARTTWVLKLSGSCQTAERSAIPHLGKPRTPHHVSRCRSEPLRHLNPSETRRPAAFPFLSTDHSASSTRLSTVPSPTVPRRAPFLTRSRLPPTSRTCWVRYERVTRGYQRHLHLPTAHCQQSRFCSRHRTFLKHRSWHTPAVGSRPHCWDRASSTCNLTLHTPLVRPHPTRRT